MIRLGLGLVAGLVVVVFIRRLRSATQIPELEYDPYAIPFGDIGSPTVSAAMN